MALLVAGDHIITRLKQTCPGAEGNVFSTADLAGVKEKSQITPALHVVLARYRPKSSDGGSSSQWRETYFVIAVVKNARQNKGSEPIINEASTLLAETLAALDGWKCPGTTALVSAVDGPDPLITDSHGYFPLAFQTLTLTEGAQDNF